MFDIRKKTHRITIKIFVCFLSFLLIHSVASNSKTIIEEIFQYVVFILSIVFFLWHPVSRPINKIIENKNETNPYSIYLLGLTFLTSFSLYFFIIFISGVIDFFNNKTSVFNIVIEILRFFSHSEIYMGTTIVWLLVSMLIKDIETKNRILNFTFNHIERVQRYDVNEGSDGVNVDVYFFGKKFKSVAKNKKAIQLIGMLKSKNVSVMNQ